MRGPSVGLLAICLAAYPAVHPALANRVTVEVWPDSSPDHVMSCSFALDDGWISMVRVKGVGMPGPGLMRWRASRAEVDAVSASLQAFVAGELGSVDPSASRSPPAPFVSVTWMTRLDDRLATGLFLHSGLAVPEPLSGTLASLGLSRSCGLSARTGG
ncbi:hypothetical protein [Tabrizicola sp.]|uniref:hypothetical protein n=1 Tax=Tabrizicola sp. TaxID=2005166 RepID=UPI0035AF296D